MAMRVYVLLLLLWLSCDQLLAQAHLDSILNQIAEEENLAGMSVAGIRQNGLAFTGSYGMRDIQRWLRVNDSTMYRIASVSKSVVAAGVMKLHETGLLNVYNDASRYLNFDLRNPYYLADSITICMLLSHTSSLQDGSGYTGFLNATAIQNPPPDLEQLLVPGATYYTSNMFRTEKPGTYFNYSNIEFGVLGTIIEKVTNMRFDIWIRENILMPLNISGSFNIQDIADINNVAVLYRYVGGQWVPQADNYQGVMPPPRNLAGYVPGNNGLIFSPAGGLRISAVDLSHFLLMIMNNGFYNGVRVLDDSTTRLFRQQQWVYTGASSGNYYYGLFRKWGMGLHTTTNAVNGDIVFPSGNPMWGHPGEAYGLISDMYGDTLSQSGVIFITNGKQGDYQVAVGSAFYTVEKSVFDAVYNWSVQNPVSVPALKKEPYVFVHPNPASGICVIRISDRRHGNIDIYNSQKQRITGKDVSEGSNYLDVSNLNPGIYFILFQSEDGTRQYHKLSVIHH